MVKTPASNKDALPDKWQNVLKKTLDSIAVCNPPHQKRATKVKSFNLS